MSEKKMKIGDKLQYPFESQGFIQRQIVTVTGFSGALDCIQCDGRPTPLLAEEFVQEDGIWVRS